MASPQTSPVRAIKLSTTTHAGVEIPSVGDSAAVLRAKYTQFVGSQSLKDEPLGVADLRRRLAEPARFPNSRSASPMPAGTRRRRRSYRRRR
jgi:hypothetical protein